MKTIAKFAAALLSAAIVIVAPQPLRAQNTNKATPAQKPAGENKAAEKKQTAEKQQLIPFRGEVGAVDKTARTITVGKRVFQITAQTKLFKGEAKTPATFDEGVVGEAVTGTYLKGEDGKLLANSVYFKSKPQAASAGTAPKKK